MNMNLEDIRNVVLCELIYNELSDAPVWNPNQLIDEPAETSRDQVPLTGIKRSVVTDFFHA